MPAAADLAALFRRAAAAHHTAFLATDGQDPDWPRWYADYLHADLNARLGEALSREDIAARLSAAEAALRAQAPGDDWPEFYARFFLTGE